MSDEEQQDNGPFEHTPEDFAAEQGEPIDMSLPEGLLAQLRELTGQAEERAGVHMGEPVAPGSLPFLGVAIEQFDRNNPETDVRVELTHENSFLLVQPMQMDGGIRYHLLTDATVPDLLNVLAQVHNVIAEGWAQQQAEIARRDEAAESYFLTRSAHCMHTPGGSGVDIDSCHRCWVESGSPHLPPVDGEYVIQQPEGTLASPIPGADEAIALTEDEPIDESRSIGEVLPLFEQRNEME